MTRFLVPLLVFLFHVTSSSQAPPARVKSGADVLIEKRLSLLRGRNVGLITNQSGRLSSGEFLLEALVARGISVRALFGPEHGIRGTGAAGEIVGDSVDPATGIQVYSLYGRIRKPVPAMLEHVDCLLFDIQDAGARFYTYLSTMGLCMEAAGEKGIPFIVLDRPNPLGGILADGPILPDSLRSFVGMFPIPVLYGLTIGELAAMINGEGWLAGGVSADLTVVPMDGWTRGMIWNDTGLPWIPPSPNIRRPETALVYGATCYLEATNVSEGRGTESPFHLIGAPFIHGAELARVLNGEGAGCAVITNAEFTPGASKFSGKACSGVKITCTMCDSLRPVRLGVQVLSAVIRSYPDSVTINRRGLGRLLGDPEALDLIKAGRTADFIAGRWEAPLLDFRKKAAKYFLYPRR